MYVPKSLCRQAPFLKPLQLAVITIVTMVASHVWTFVLFGTQIHSSSNLVIAA